MSDCSNAQLACAIIDAWNSRDLRRFLALLSEDCVVENCHEAPASGHDAARTLLQRYVTDLPSVWFDVIEVVATEHTAVVSWWAIGTLCDEGGGGTARRTGSSVRRTRLCWPHDRALRGPGRKRSGSTTRASAPIPW
jgi:ketosteroid isomerase-like protein